MTFFLLIVLTQAWHDGSSRILSQMVARKFAYTLVKFHLLTPLVKKLLMVAPGGTYFIIGVYMARIHKGGLTLNHGLKLNHLCEYGPLTGSASAYFE